MILLFHKINQPRYKEESMILSSLKNAFYILVRITLRLHLKEHRAPPQKESRVYVSRHLMRHATTATTRSLLHFPQ